MTSSPVSPPPTDDVSDRKSTLFCQNCGHASPVDGDWTVRTAGDSRRVRCPECRDVVDERRVPDRRRGGVGPAAPVRRYVDAWHRYWSAWTSLLADGSRADC
jgi:hypothetical protein